MTLVLHPAMPSAGAPDWPGARWIGDLDLERLESSTGVTLLESEGYTTARLLVRRGEAVLGFVDVPIARGQVAADALRRALDGLRRPSAKPTAAAEIPDDALPRVTVIVCTRDRADHLRGALTAILELDYPSFDVVVVDNASKTSETRDLIRDEFDDIRVIAVEEPRPGLAKARNTGLLRASGDIVAYTDDDVIVDRRWLRALVAAFRSDETVACVAGLVPSGELRTRVQGYFDDRVSWSKNLERRAFSLAHPPSDSPLFPFSVGDYGTGANFALTREAALSLGGFDTAFGVGTPTGGGEDIDMFTRVVLAGHTLVVEPSAIVWHRHRADLDALRVQARGYGIGLGAWLAKVLSTPETAKMAAARGPRAVRKLLSLGQGDAPRVPAPVGSRASGTDSWQKDVAATRRLELTSVLLGPARYAAQRRAGEGLLTTLERLGLDSGHPLAVDPDRAVSLGCVILAHEDPAHVRRLIAALDPFPVFLHCDVTTPDPVYRAMTDGLPERVTLMPRIRTGWARWENVQAELDGYRAALAKTDVTHVALLTGSDYPIVGTAELAEFLETFRDRSILHVSPLPYAQWGRGGGLDRLRYRHWARGKRMLRLPIPRRLPRGIRFAGGSQLKVLSREHAEALLAATDARPDLVRFWRRSWVADETYVPSIVNTPSLVPGFAAKHVPKMLWWIGWDGARKKSPPFLGMESEAALLSRKVWVEQDMECLFARKFSTAISTDVLDALDAARSSADRGATTA